MERVLEGRPTLAVMPTGAGKSLCYQLPALALPGVAVVVSPLISLMEDQVRGLQRRGVRAAAWTSMTGVEERRGLLRDLESGELDLLYVAPERFQSGWAFERIRSARPSLFVVDEVHCVSQWGHDFRPDYARLGEVLERLSMDGSIRFIGLTATATPQVREDVAQSLGVAGSLDVVVTGFDRPNLELSVLEVGGGSRGLSRKLDQIDTTLKRWMGATGSAIVYAPTRKQSEQAAEGLAELGYSAAAYHAGLDATTRTQIQSTFEQEPSQVVVATSAFGMGIDKPDVRVVVHLALPDSPEAYYQEVGRAGRDGDLAGGVLLWSPSDVRYAHRRLEAACPTPELVELLRDDLSVNLPDASDIDFEALSNALESRYGPGARAGLVALERAGDLVWGENGFSLLPGPGRLKRHDLESRARYERHRLSTAIGYVTRANCRRRYLVEYFGDPNSVEACGICDRCRAPQPALAEGDLHTAALKALSCIARVRGRYGKTRVVDVLIGARTKAVLDAGLDHLSTHGLLSTWLRPDLMSLIDSLVRARLARLTLDEFPRLVLTEEGAETLRKRGPIHLDWQKAEVQPKPIKPKGSSSSSSAIDEDDPLFVRLRLWRTERAREESVPPYVIAHNRLLHGITQSRPQTLEALGEVAGMGPTKIERYGEALLEIVRSG